MSAISQTIPSLNGIRAISVLIVVLSHTGLGTIVPGGLGVTIFFFLSGYLITTLMLAEQEQTGSLDIFGFYARRVCRLMPPLLITLSIAYGLVASGILPGAITLKGLAAQLLYFANYYSLFFDPGNATIPAGTGILWSLAVEEHYYVFYPLVMTAVFKAGLNPKRIGIILAIACVTTLIWRIELVQHGFSEPRTYYASDTRIDSIIYGALLALWVNPVSQPRRPMLPREWAAFVMGLGFLLISLVYRGAAFRETFRYSLQGFALLPIFYFSIRFHDNFLFRHLNSNLMTKIGIWSYSIYLIHFVLINAVIANAPDFSDRPFWLFVLTLSLSCCYAAAIDRFVDPYFRRLRKQFHADRGKRPTAESVTAVVVNGAYAQPED
jgi:peptidoglycan/LPS O-acetylase OafA/YrhL